MREVELKIKAYLDQESQWQRKSQRLPKGGALVVVLVAVIIVFASRRSPLGSGASQFDARPAHVVVLNNKEVKGERVLVLIDNSGSMIGKDPEPQLTRLVAAGISIINRVNVPGFGISFTDRWSLLPVFNAAMAANPNVDVVYIISDFAQGDERANDPVARQQLQRTLSSRQARIYWATVDLDPSAEYYEIAMQTGGDVIPKDLR